jgi:hypothetical protein
MESLIVYMKDPAVHNYMQEHVVAILALIVSLVSLTLTAVKGRYDQIVGIKPALIFAYDRDAGWQIQNIGNGPALNIIVAQINSVAQSTNWERPVQIRPLRKDGNFEIHWDRDNDTHGFGAMYEDMWAREYTTICRRDLNRLQSGWHLGRWKAEEIIQEHTLRKENVIK